MSEEQRGIVFDIKEVAMHDGPGIRTMVWDRLKTGMAWLSLSYAGAFLCWYLAYLVFRDRFWWLFFLNSFAVYYILPFPLALAAAAVTRRKTLIAGCVVVAAIWLGLFGSAFMPRTSQSDPGPDGLQVLVAMTFNADGFSDNTEQVLRVLGDSNADIIALQELTPPLAEEIASRLGGKYPHQHLRPLPGPHGMGILSRHAFTASTFPKRARWGFEPQLVHVDFNGTPVAFVNAHLSVTLPGRPATMTRTIHARKAQAKHLAALAQAIDKPLIIAADLNATPLSEPYAMLTNTLTDTWRRAGPGLGHTFPGNRLLLGVIPRWVVRIDYVFCSSHWETVAANLGAWHGKGDHRPVIARLGLRPD